MKKSLIALGSKKPVVAATIAALLGGAAVTANAVEVSRDGTGDFLIAPAYMIGGGLTTDLKVINTSDTDSVVAKVVFRHPVTSAETLDFLIYLSPSDVWTGTVSCQAADAAGNCTKSVVTSKDDSIQLPNSTSFASATVASEIVSDNATASATGRVALPNQGYIEIIEGSAYAVAPNRPGVLKSNILAAHEAAGNLVAQTATPNYLAGSVTINAASLGSATLPMEALANYDNTFKVQVGVASGLDVAGQRTSVADVEEALWVNNIAVPYVAPAAGKFSLATFTFPTKLTYNNVTDGQYPFASKTCITANVYDNFENTIIGTTFNVSPLPTSPQTCVDEFQWLMFGSNIGIGSFTEGWARIRFSDARVAVAQTLTPAASYNAGRAGVPAIVTYMIQDGARLNWAYAASAR